MSLPTRKIGQTQVSAIGYGAMGLSSFYGAISQTDEERFAVCPSARSCSDLPVINGLRLARCSTPSIATAASSLTQPTRTATLKISSANGAPFLTILRITVTHSNIFVCRFKRSGKREDIFLATKFGFKADSDRRIDGRPEYVREAVASSLKRLGVDQIDLYYLHRADPLEPIEVRIPTMYISACTDTKDPCRTQSVQWLNL